MAEHLHPPNGGATVWRCVCCEEYLLKPAFIRKQRLSETPTCKSCVAAGSQEKKPKKKKSKNKIKPDAEEAEKAIEPETLKRLQGVVVDAQRELAQYATSSTEIDTNPVVTINMKRQPIFEHLAARKRRITTSRKAMAELERLLNEYEVDEESKQSAMKHILLERRRLARVEANLLVREAMILAALLKRQGHSLSPALQSVVDAHATANWESEVLTQHIYGFKLSASMRESLRKYRLEKRAKSAQTEQQVEHSEESLLDNDGSDDNE
ncbi:hypothetical protein PINS_up012759 [Pythium insidiosum]|nr:hypothetical protein PINS_up012759 [Pythium insidiosum]